MIRHIRGHSTLYVCMCLYFRSFVFHLYRSNILGSYFPGEILKFIQDSCTSSAKELCQRCMDGIRDTMPWAYRLHTARSVHNVIKTYYFDRIRSHLFCIKYIFSWLFVFDEFMFTGGINVFISRSITFVNRGHTDCWDLKISFQSGTAVCVSYD